MFTHDHGEHVFHLILNREVSCYRIDTCLCYSELGKALACSWGGHFQGMISTVTLRTKTRNRCLRRQRGAL